MKIRLKSPYKVLVQFQKLEDAYQLINCKKILDLDYHCLIVNETYLSFGVVKGIDIGIEEQEILENLTSSCEISSLKRLKRLDINGKWTDSEAFRLTFKSEQPPSYVYGYGCRFKVEIYHFPVTQCSGCWSFGHYVKFCPNKKILCPKCGDRCETIEYKCVNCKGPHVALDKACSIFVKENSIRNIMSQQHFSYRKALDIYLKQTKQTMDSPTSMNKVQKADKASSADYTKSYRDILLTNNYINQNLSDTESGEEDTSKEQATYKNIKNKHIKKVPNYNVKHSKQKSPLLQPSQLH
ncbi:unnamed protein product [Parnassius apollo]|uniref:(apollo) hypothetical protein n=1 Tax=Parnassius apollo TaxID=110799 RepID=A0A8S3XT98_PARAO|nr:unnamed protein product [Parnassius apollo]